MLLLAVAFCSALVWPQVRPCPPPEDIQPCTCHRNIGPPNIKCIGLKNGTQLKAILRHFNNFRLDGLEIEESGLGYLPPGLFKGASFKSVIFYRSMVKLASDGMSPFAGLQDSLTVFGCTVGGPLDEWNWKHFAQLRSLKTIIVGSNKWKIIPKSLSDGPTHLEIFVSTLNGVKEIEDGAFASFTNLSKLAINHHELTTLRREFLPRPAEHLVDISFRFGRLQYLADNFFEDMPSLKVLDLSYNSFATLAETTLAPFWKQVVKFTFRENPVVCDCKLKWLAGQKQRLIELPSCFEPEALQDRNLKELNADDLIC